MIFDPFSGRICVFHSRQPLNMVYPSPFTRVVSSLLNFHLQTPHLTANPFQTDARTQNSSRFIDIDLQKTPKSSYFSSLLDYVYGISKILLNQSRLCHCDIESLIREQQFHLKPRPFLHMTDSRDMASSTHRRPSIILGHF